MGEDDVPDLILSTARIPTSFGPRSAKWTVSWPGCSLEAKVGANYLLAMTADHGMPSEPPSPDRRHFAPSLIDLLHRRFDPEAKKLVTAYDAENCQIFVDEDRLSDPGLTLRALGEFLESQPFLFAVFTEDDVRRAAGSAKSAASTRGHAR